MFKPCTLMSFAATFALTGCLTTQYEDSPVTAVQSRAQAPVYAQPINASYQTVQTSAAEQDCRKQETNRELIGGALGGTAGAFVGKELIGGTKGVIAGAALGGIAGYGIGDISKNCSPAATRSNVAYQNAHQYSATPARFETASCPAGTTPHAASGSCLLTDSAASFSAQSTATTSMPSAPTPSPQRTIPATRAQNIVRASAATPAAPYMGQEITRTYGGANYRVKSGDTVYSLARKLCVPVAAIQGSNGLDANYGIQIGQGLSLPASQC